MRYRKLGRTGLEVSLIGLGTMTWGNQNTLEEGHAQMDYALDQGVNFWDTAEMYAVPPSPETYGTTETIIGEWFARSGRREDVILASKIAGPGLPWVREGKAFVDRKNIEIAVEESLKRLQTDYRSVSNSLAEPRLELFSAALGLESAARFCRCGGEFCRGFGMLCRSDQSGENPSCRLVERNCVGHGQMAGAFGKARLTAYGVDPE